MKAERSHPRSLSAQEWRARSRSDGSENAPIVGLTSDNLAELTHLLARLPGQLDVTFLLFASDAFGMSTEEVVAALQLCTERPVRAIEQGAGLQAGHVYVVPPSATVSRRGGPLRCFDNTLPIAYWAADLMHLLPAGLLLAEAPLGRIVFANKQVLDLLGPSCLEASSIERYGAWQIHTPDGEPYPAENIPLARALLSGETVSGEEAVLRRGEVATILRLSAAPLQDHGGHITAALMVVEDVSDGHRTMEQLRLSEERFRVALQNSPVVVFSMDRDLRLTWIHNFESDEPPEDLVGSSEDDLLECEEDVATVTAIKKRVLETGIGERQEISLTRRGRPWHLDLTVEPLRNRHGHVIGVTGTAVDITRQKELEQHLRRHERELESLANTLEERVMRRTEQVRALTAALGLAEERERNRIARILHDDLQQLLYGLGMSIGQLRRRNPTEEQQRFLEQMDEILARAIDVTRTLSVELSPPLLHEEDIAGVLHWLAAQMEEVHGLHVELDIRNPVRIASDDVRVMVFQSVRELLFNVVKHAGVQQARVVITTDEHAVRIQIEDDGAGFDLESVLFSHDPRRGVGLLSIGERLELFGGRLDIRSSPGEGTCMTIVIPVQNLGPDQPSSDIARA